MVLCFSGGDDMDASRRMKHSLGWYPGPFLIGVTSIAADVGADVDWFERIMSEPPSEDRRERLISMKVVQSLCDQIEELSPKMTLLDVMQRQTNLQANSLVAISLGEFTLKAVLMRAAVVSLLNANLFTYRFENLPSRKAYALTFLPIVPIPRWLHLCFAYQFSEGLISATGNNDIEVEGIVVCGARLTGDLDLQANVDMGDRDSRRFLDSAPSRVIYKAKALDQVNRLSNKPWRNFFNSMTNPLLSSRLKTAPWTYRTYLMILKHFEDGLSLSMEGVSNSLGADVSTLRRYLQAESTGFKHLITLFRYQQAQLMIIDGVSIEQMARSLDFKNPVSVKRLVRSKGFCGEDATALRDAGN